MFLNICTKNYKSKSMVNSSNPITLAINPNFLILRKGRRGLTGTAVISTAAEEQRNTTARSRERRANTAVAREILRAVIFVLYIYVWGRKARKSRDWYSPFIIGGLGRHTQHNTTRHAEITKAPLQVVTSPTFFILCN